MSVVQLARRYYDYFNERRFDEAGELVDPEAVFHYIPTSQGAPPLDIPTEPLGWLPVSTSASWSGG